MSDVPSGDNPVLRAALDFPARLRQAAAATGEQGGVPLDLPDPPNALVVLDAHGPGGPGDIFTSLAGHFCPFPSMLIQSLDVPAFVNEDSLAVFFGAGEEDEGPLGDAADVFASRGATLIALASKEDIASEKVRRHGGKVLSVPAVSPWNAPGLAELLFPSLVLLDRIHGPRHFASWSAEAEEELATLIPRHAAAGGMAETLARDLGRTIPLFVGDGLVGEAIARQWKACYNMTCRAPAFSSSLADAAGSELQGWGQHGDITRQLFSLVVIRHDDQHPDAEAKSERLLEAMQEFTHGQHVVESPGGGVFTQYVDLMVLGQLVAFHRAAQEGLVPSGPTSYRL